jgi:6-phosphogluconolactonase
MPSVASGDGPTSVTVDSQGRFAYVTNAIAGSVSVFAIDVATGALTPRSTVSAGTNPVALTLDPSGRFAYVANLGSDNVTPFAIDSATGVLTPAGSPANAAQTRRRWHSLGELSRFGAVNEYLTALIAS